MAFLAPNVASGSFLFSRSNSAPATSCAQMKWKRQDREITMTNISIRFLQHLLQTICLQPRIFSPTVGGLIECTSPKNRKSIYILYHIDAFNSRTVMTLLWATWAENKNEWRLLNTSLHETHVCARFCPAHDNRDILSPLDFVSSLSRYCWPNGVLCASRVVQTSLTQHWFFFIISIAIYS